MSAERRLRIVVVESRGRFAFYSVVILAGGTSITRDAAALSMRAWRSGPSERAIDAGRRSSGGACIRSKADSRDEAIARLHGSGSRARGAWQFRLPIAGVRRPSWMLERGAANLRANAMPTLVEVLREGGGATLRSE